MITKVSDQLETGKGQEGPCSIDTASLETVEKLSSGRYVSVKSRAHSTCIQIHATGSESSVRTLNSSLWYRIGRAESMKAYLSRAVEASSGSEGF